MRVNEDKIVSRVSCDSFITRERKIERKRWRFRRRNPSVFLLESIHRPEPRREDGGGGVGAGGGRFMNYPPPLSVPPSAPQSPNFSGGLRSQPSFLVEQEKYLSELLRERHKLTPFMLVLPHVCRLMNQATPIIVFLQSNGYAYVKHVTAVGHVAMLAAIQRYAPGLVMLSFVLASALL